MIINSLNCVWSDSYKSLDNHQVAQHKAWFPTIIISIMVIVPFFTVLNDDLFDIYFYQGYGFMLSCVGIVFAAIAYIIQQGFILKGKFIKMLSYSGLTLLYCAISAVVVHSGFRYVGVVFNTMGTVMLLSYSRISKYTIKIITLFLTVSALICIFTVHDYYGNQIKGESVNSNYLAFFGIVIMVYGNLFTSYLIQGKRRSAGLLRIAICVASFYIIWECQSRGSLLAWIFYFFCVYIFPIKWFRSKQMITIISIAIAIVGVLFTYLYVSELNGIIGTFMGKSTATRMRLWSFFWEHIGDNKLNLLLGYGTRSMLRDTFGYGLHNIYIGIWYDVGIIGLMLFVTFNIMTLRNAFNKDGSASNTQMYAIIGFLTFMILDYFAITFTGPLVIWNYMLLGMVNRTELDNPVIVLRWKR